MFNARVKSRIGKNIFSVMRKRIYLKINCRNQTKWNAIQHTWCGCLFTHWIAWPGMYGVCMLEIWVATYVLAGENVLLMGNMDYSATKIFSTFFSSFLLLCVPVVVFLYVEWNTLSKQNQYKWYERIILVCSSGINLFPNFIIKMGQDYITIIGLWFIRCWRKRYLYPFMLRLSVSLDFIGN